MNISNLDRKKALDHIVVVTFENRSLDNVLGHLYGPEDGKTFEGVKGKGLSNPIPKWAEHGADRKVVPYKVATDMDSPNPDSGEEYYHTNTQLFNTIDDHNRFKIREGVTAPWNAPPPGARPTMDGFVTDYISAFTAEVGRQPTYDEYAHIMTGYTPEQVPVLSGIAREFGVFDHWFCEVPSQTLMNRSFWTAATSSGLVVNAPVTKWFTKNDTETIFERLEQHGKTWKIYVNGMPCSFEGIIHYSRLKDRFATHVVPFSEFEKDAAAGTLPDFSWIEPNCIAGHGDYHPAFGRSAGPQFYVEGLDPPSSILLGEAFLERVFNAYRSATSASAEATTSFVLVSIEFTLAHPRPNRLSSTPVAAERLSVAAAVRDSNCRPATPHPAPPGARETPQSTGAPPRRDAASPRTPAPARCRCPSAPAPASCAPASRTARSVASPPRS